MYCSTGSETLRTRILATSDSFVLEESNESASNRICRKVLYAFMS
jgi:hypothetical protein